MSLTSYTRSLKPLWTSQSKPYRVKSLTGCEEVADQVQQVHHGLHHLQSQDPHHLAVQDHLQVLPLSQHQPQLWTLSLGLLFLEEARGEVDKLQEHRMVDGDAQHCQGELQDCGQPSTRTPM